MSTPAKEEAARVIRVQAAALQEAINIAAQLGLNVQLHVIESEQFGLPPIPMVQVKVTEELGR